MTERWVVVADSSRARIFKVLKTDGELKETETLVHPEARGRDQDLTSDLPGRSFDSSGQGRHAMESESGPKHQELLRFCKAVGDRLNHAHKSGELGALYIIAPPEVLGLLREQLDKNTGKALVGDLAKNFSKLQPKELLQHLPKPFLHVIR